MKVLWASYAALGKAAELLEKKRAQSGTWIDATANELIKNSNIELSIACISKKTDKVIDPDTGIQYIGISEIHQLSGVKPQESEKDTWKKVITESNPDIIMVWGTEYANGTAIIEAADKIPVLVFIQGVLGKIIDYPFGNLSMKEVFRVAGMINTIKFLHYKNIYHAQKRQCRFEKEIIDKCAGIITDNEWANSYFKSFCPKLDTFFYPLPVNSLFLNGNRKEIEKYSIFTIDGGNPAKGVFHLINALKIVKKVYPNVKLYIPGRIPTGTPKILRESPYYTYLKKLIAMNNLAENVIFLGQLTQEQMREQLAKCSIFVMPSSIENHSSSLREAMYMGVPAISSLVGSVPEFAIYGHNMLTYRYEEEEILAAQIMKLFDDPIYAEKIGDCGRNTINKMFPQVNLGQRMLEIYKEVLENE
ncbi:hypothetical protein JCM17039_03530 [Blautia glucerasea]